jgi:single-strand selective monofunctional uracil DNA glycosylase
MVPVEQACMKHLEEVIGVLRPSYLIGIGGFAEERLRRAALPAGSPVTIGRILHPSPASPAANRGWAETASRQLAELGIW